MSDTKPSPARKALDYAEKALGANETYDHAVQALATLSEEVEKVTEQKKLKRSLDEQIESQVMELTIEEASKHTEMSVAAMERHMKVVLARSPELSALRAQLSLVNGQIEYLDYQIRIVETDVKIVTARLTELGGYFSYLAAIKLAHSTNKTSEAGAVP